MHQIRNLEEYEKMNGPKSALFIPEKMIPDYQRSNRNAHNLWQHAKRRFYYGNDHPGAASLCKRLIALYARTVEADEAKLLLHDIRIEIKKLTEECEAKPDGPVPEGQGSRTSVAPLLRDTRTKISIATAVVVAPVIGIAQGGVVGIVVPEIVSLLAMGAAFWIVSSIGVSLRKKAAAGRRPRQSSKCRLSITGN